ncbi:unnamed protein product, partial [Porites evermanni]
GKRNCKNFTASMQLLMVCLLVGVTMSALVYASALQQCMQSSKYGSHYGVALLGYSYKSFVANLHVTCYRTCQQEPSCQSLNYNLANRICEFNSFAKGPDDLEDKLDNFVYAVNPNRKVEDKWITLRNQTPQVCFGAKHNQFGRFWIPFTGFLVRVKLVHLSGLIRCSRWTGWFNWGCKRGKIHTLITNSSDSILLPRREKGSILNGFEIPGYFPTSPQLVFPDI